MNNYNNGILFQGTSPIMTGTWYNPSTGDSFTVKDTFFENNEYVVYTTDNRMLNYNQIQHYVQTDNKDMIEDKLPPEVSAMLETNNDTDILPEDQLLINGNFYDKELQKGLQIPHIQIDVNKSATTPVTDNTHIIEKALSKTILPDISVKLNCTKYPEREIDMLVDIMDIPVSEIVDWYINKFGANEIKKLMEDSIKSYFNINDNEEAEGDAITADPIIKKTKAKNKK